MPLIVDGILVTLEYFPENWVKTRIGKLTDEQILEIRRHCGNRQPSANGKFEGSAKFWTKYFFSREDRYEKWEKCNSARPEKSAVGSDVCLDGGGPAARKIPHLICAFKSR